MQLLAVFGVVSASAYNVGEYIYSNTAKYKVESANLVQNGTFANGLTGWTNENAGEVSGTTWGVTLNAGPGGINAVESLDGAPSGDNQYLCNVWNDMSGLYAISFYVKSPTAYVSSNTAGNSNYIDFYVNTDGLVALNAVDKQMSKARNVAEAISVDTEWTLVVDTFEIHSGEFFVFSAAKLVTGTQMTDFQLVKVSQVYDTREAERLLAYTEALSNEPDLQVNVDEFKSYIGMLKAALQDPTQSESPEAMEGLLISFYEMFDNYIDENAANTRSGDWFASYEAETSTNTRIGDWSTRGSVNWNNINNAKVVGSWTTIGGRWGFSANDESLERPAGDGYVLSGGIQTGYDLGEIGVKVSRTDLEPGKYLFAIEAQEVAAGNKSAPYGANYNKVFEGPSIFVGTDTLVMRPATEVELADASSNKKYKEVADTLSGYHWNYYYFIGEVKEGETVEAGFLFPPYSDSRGGRASLRNPVFRQIGKTTTQLDHETAVKYVITQQTELKNRLETYPTELTDYKWEQDSLQRAMAVAQSLLDGSYAQVTVDGTCTVPATKDGVADLIALRQTLLDQVNAMGRARNWVINQNAIQKDLTDKVAEGQAVLDDPLSAKGDAGLRSALQTAINDAQALINGISATNQYVEFGAAINNINDAIEAFKISYTSRKAPAPIQIKNGDFSLDGGNNTSNSFSKNGWNYTGTGTFKQWQFGTAGEPSFANQWRGSTVTLGGKAQQVVTLTRPGVYEYRCRAYAGNDNLAHRMGTAVVINDAEDNPIDTTYYDTPARLFFGKDGAPDSIVVSKCIAPGASNSAVASRPWRNIDGYTAFTYSVFYVKTSAEEEQVEFGLEVDPREVGYGLNFFGFGENVVYFLGNEADYITDTDADLNEQVARANRLIAAQGQTDDYGWLCIKLQRYVADAQAATTLKDKQYAYFALMEISDLIENAILGIDPISADEKKVAAKKQGVFTISGVKIADGLKNLKPGLYIVDGRKLLVR